MFFSFAFLISYLFLFVFKKKIRYTGQIFFPLLSYRIVGVQIAWIHTLVNCLNWITRSPQRRCAIAVLFCPGNETALQSEACSLFCCNHVNQILQSRISKRWTGVSWCYQQFITVCQNHLLPIIRRPRDAANNGCSLDPLQHELREKKHTLTARKTTTKN